MATGLSLDGVLWRRKIVSQPLIEGLYRFSVSVSVDAPDQAVLSALTLEGFQVLWKQLM